MRKLRPEIAKSEFLNRIYVNKKLISDTLENLLKNIKGKKVLEIEGIGIIAEYISRNGNEVRLCEDDSIYFDYRAQVVPTSTVVRLNTNPHNLKSKKPYYDYVIIHSTEFEGVAKLMSKDKIILVDYQDNIEKIYEQFEYNTQLDQPITKNAMPEKGD